MGAYCLDLGNGFMRCSNAPFEGADWIEAAPPAESAGHELRPTFDPVAQEGLSGVLPDDVYARLRDAATANVFSVKPRAGYPGEAPTYNAALEGMPKRVEIPGAHRGESALEAVFRQAREEILAGPDGSSEQLVPNLRPNFAGTGPGNANIKYTPDGAAALVASQFGLRTPISARPIERPGTSEPPAVPQPVIGAQLNSEETSDLVLASFGRAPSFDKDGKKPVTGESTPGHAEESAECKELRRRVENGTATDIEKWDYINRCRGIMPDPGYGGPPDPFFNKPGGGEPPPEEPAVPPKKFVSPPACQCELICYKPTGIGWNGAPKAWSNACTVPKGKYLIARFLTSPIGGQPRKAKYHIECPRGSKIGLLAGHVIPNSNTKAGNELNGETTCPNSNAPIEFTIVPGDVGTFVITGQYDGAPKCEMTIEVVEAGDCECTLTCLEAETQSGKCSISIYQGYVETDKKMQDPNDGFTFKPLLPMLLSLTADVAKPDQQAWRVRSDLGYLEFQEDCNPGAAFVESAAQEPITGMANCPTDEPHIRFCCSPTWSAVDELYKKGGTNPKEVPKITDTVIAELRVNGEWVLCSSVDVSLIATCDGCDAFVKDLSEPQIKFEVVNNGIMDERLLYGDGYHIVASQEHFNVSLYYKISVMLEMGHMWSPPNCCAAWVSTASVKIEVGASVESTAYVPGADHELKGLADYFLNSDVQDFLAGRVKESLRADCPNDAELPALRDKKCFQAPKTGEGGCDSIASRARAALARCAENGLYGNIELIRARYRTDCKVAWNYYCDNILGGPTWPVSEYLEKAQELVDSKSSGSAAALAAALNGHILLDYREFYEKHRAQWEYSQSRKYQIYWASDADVQATLDKLCPVGWFFEFRRFYPHFDADGIGLIRRTGQYEISLASRFVSISTIDSQGNDLTPASIAANLRAALGGLAAACVDANVEYREEVLSAIDNQSNCVALRTCAVVARFGPKLNGRKWSFANAWTKSDIGLDRLKAWATLMASECLTALKTPNCTVLPKATKAQLAAMIAGTRGGHEYGGGRGDDVFVFFGHGGVDAAVESAQKTDKEGLTEAEQKTRQLQNASNGLYCTDGWLSGEELAEAARKCSGVVILFACRSYALRHYFPNARIVMGSSPVDWNTGNWSDNLTYGGLLEPNVVANSIGKLLTAMAEFPKRNQSLGLMMSELKPAIDGGLEQFKSENPSSAKAFSTYWMWNVDPADAASQPMWSQ